MSEISNSLEVRDSPHLNDRKNLWMGAAMVVAIAYTIVRSSCRADVKLFWYDELCTWIVTSLSSPASIWHALAQAADSMPPAFYLLESVLGKLIPNQHIAFRAPSIIGAGVSLWSLFLWLKPRFGPVIAFSSALIPVMTVFDSTYAVEARSYSLVVACIAVALICYDRIQSAGWAAAFAVSLFLAESFHYYAIFALAPFLAAE